MAEQPSAWVWAAATGGVAAVGGAIAWASFRRSVGPPRAESLNVPGAPAPIPMPAPALPPPGTKAKSYPGARGGSKGPVDTQLEPGDGYVIRRVSRAWGTQTTVEGIKRAAALWVAQAPAFALDHIQLKINDISKKGGGTLPPHKSHHQGRDVDVTLAGVDGEKLSAVALPLLLRVFLADPGVQVIFLDWHRQQEVWHALEVNPELNGEVKRELQFPLAPHSGHTRVRHWPGHANHIHVRYRA